MTDTIPPPPEEAATRIEKMHSLDPIVEKATKIVSPIARPSLRRALSGSWLGHPLHPVLTAAPLGAWTSAALLDISSNDVHSDSARRLVCLGVLSAAPTAVAGVSDWLANTDNAEQKRVGLVHALSNTIALGLYTGSWIARCKGKRLQGKVLGFAGLAAINIGGYLGGHLTYKMNVGVDDSRQ